MDTLMRDQNVEHSVLQEQLIATQRRCVDAKRRVAEGEEPVGASLGGRLARIQLNLVRLRYSAGADLSDLEHDMRVAVRTMLEHGWEDALRGTERTLETVGMIRLFGLDDLLEPMWWAIRPVPSVLDYLLTGHRRWVTEGAEVPRHTGGRDLIRFIDKLADAPDTAPAVLASYVRSDWYQSWAGKPGWGSHERPSHGYYGYWAFDVAAMAKLHNVDDSALKGNRYYPYDLAHYKD